MKKQFDVNAKYLAVPVWTAEKWDFYNLDVLSESAELLFSFQLSERTGISEKPDYYAYFPVTAQKAIILESDAPLSFFDAVFLTDEPIIGGAHEEGVLHYHAPYGFINDPNGLVYDNGLWHLYHQHNPLNNVWGNMSWGHAVSRDLVHFTWQGDTILPDKEGVMFSGCGLKNERGLLGLPTEALLFFYTYAAREHADTGEILPRFSQRLAYSLDGGRSLIKYPDFELKMIEAENRDPKVFFHPESNAYIMSLFLTKNRFGIFRSENLREWLMTCELDYPPMWECPDLLRLGEKWAFMSADGYYYIGSFDGYTFTAETEMDCLYADHLPYAAQSFSNVSDRVISIAWLRAENRGTNYTGFMSIPRELSLGQNETGYYIRQRFISEADPYIIRENGRTVIADSYIHESIDQTGHKLFTEQR